MYRQLIDLMQRLISFLTQFLTKLFKSMKKVVLSIFSLSIVLIGLSIVLSSSSQGRAFAANAGNTGAPGESTVCGSCHAGGSFTSTTYQIELLDSQNNVVNSYIPGNVYTLRGSFTTPIGGISPPRYGFQVVSLIGTNTAYNAWSSPSANARVASASNGRSYAEHRGPSASNVYTVNWTAPTAGSGNVTFYSAANGVNRNSNTSGDNSFRNQITISESISTGISNVESVSDFLLYPNPVKNVLYITGAPDFKGALSIIDQSGKVVLVAPFNGPQLTLQMGDLSNGLYFVRAESTTGELLVNKIIKQ